MHDEAVVLMLGGEDALEDPTALIVDAVGTYENCTFIPFVKHTHNTECKSELHCFHV